jgi:cytosine/adenosine deaminase-related metal-dependent hydrolase
MLAQLIATLYLHADDARGQDIVVEGERIREVGAEVAPPGALGNPLEDIRVLEDIRFVMVGGQIIKGE